MMKKIEHVYSGYLEQQAGSGLLRSLNHFRRIGPREIETGGKRYLNFAGNDYLGLSFHPAVIARSQEWAGQYGAGAGASRLVTGNLEAYAKIEKRMAAFKGFEECLIFASGFQANASVLPALFDSRVLGAEPIVFSDRLIHASMHLGCAAAGAAQTRFKHNDLPHLESLLHKASNRDAPKFILTESVFSMDGDLAPIGGMREAADMYGASLIADEAHATGILGPGGKGLAEKAELVIGTFSKAMGSFGAYVACSAAVKEYLVNKCSGLIYATALPPAVLGAIDAALDLVPGMDAERARVARLASEFRDEIKRLGFRTGLSASQITPVIVGEAAEAMRMSEGLRDRGIWVGAIRPPTVPENTARLRFSFTAAHGEDDLDRLTEALKILK